MKLTATQLAGFTQATIANAQRYVDHLNESMTRYEITTPKRVAAFTATLSVESARLTAVEEGLYYKSAERLASIYPRAFKSPKDALPYVRNPRELSRLLYDGYHGRGLIQLTWLSNYIKARDALGFDYVKNPQLVCEPMHAALTAAWYWDEANCNEAADRSDMSEVTRRVNGSRRMHLAERVSLYDLNIGAMGVRA